MAFLSFVNPHKYSNQNSREEVFNFEDERVAAIYQLQANHSSALTAPRWVHLLIFDIFCFLPPHYTLHDPSFVILK